MGNDIYLGDGLYASFDGFMIKLWTERDNGTHFVYLEPAVWTQLVEVVRIWHAGMAAAAKKEAPQ